MKAGYGWRIAGLSLAVLLLLLLLIYQETILYLISLWNDLEHGEYGHGYLILAVSGYLIQRNWRALSLLTPCPCYSGLLAILATSLLWILITLVDVLVLQTVSLLLFILAIVWAILGKQISKKLLFPLLFLGFALPVWFPLNPVMQDLSADVVFRIIRILGIPAFMQDNKIVLPSGSLSVTEACSGLRYLLPGLALGTLYGYLNYVSFRARLIVFSIMASASILINILRVFIVVYAAHVTEMQHPFVKDHLALGWYLFAAMVIILLFVDTLWYRYYATSEDQRPQDNSTLSSTCGKGTLQQMSIVVISAILLSIGSVAIYWINNQTFPENRQAKLELPSGTGGWNGPVESDNDWMPDYRGAISRKQTYQKGNRGIDLYIGYYRVQKQGKELIYYANRIGNKDIWHSQNPKGSLIQTSGREVLEQLLERDGGVQRLVWYWYHVAGVDTANRYHAKALQVLGLVTANPQAYIMAVSINNKQDVIDARKVLGDFISSMETPLTMFTEQSNP